VRTLRIRGWLVIAGCLVVTSVVYCTIHLRSRTSASPQAVASAEDEVYGAVVRDMVTPIHGQAHITQLVFDDTLLTDLAPGTDMKSCKEGARKHVGLEGNTPPPFNSFADKIYRVLTRGWYDSSPRAEAIQDFLGKSCIVGLLSTTFHTELPRAFIETERVHFNGWPIEKNGSPSFEQLFPGASGIISFSHVGFDSSLHEAIVSTSFVCGGLCGTGHRYVLKRKWGRWQVASKWITWVS
jgi:hypothetical protein